LIEKLDSLIDATEKYLQATHVNDHSIQRLIMAPLRHRLLRRSTVATAQHALVTAKNHFNYVQSARNVALITPGGSRTFALTSPRPSDPPKPNNITLPLAGTLVISLEQAIAGPFCTRQLADQGARVIKIERPGRGDFNRAHDTRVKGLCSHFVWTNRSKESLALDLKDPKDLATLKTLLAKADVLVQNLAPGATERMGLGFEALKVKHPGLIVCDVSGYGSTGPYRNKKAYDLLIQAEAGFLSITGSPGQPAKAGISIADIAAGTTAYNNILAALLARHRTGKGCRLDVSMLESIAEWMSFPLYYAYEGADPPGMSGAEHASIYPYGPFETGEEGMVMLGMQNEREWGIFCRQILGKGELLEDERFSSTSKRSENRRELKRIIEDVFQGADAGTWLDRLQEAGIANAKVNDMQDLWNHPQLKARDRWSEVDTTNGAIRALKPAGAADGQAVRMDPIPGVDQHGETILEEFGIKK
jgi:itaconate CoA-transferase